MGHQGWDTGSGQVSGKYRLSFVTNMFGTLCVGGGSLGRWWRVRRVLWSVLPFLHWFFLLGSSRSPGCHWSSRRKGRLDRWMCEEGLPCSWVMLLCRPGGDLLPFTGRHVHFAILKFRPLGMKHINLTADVESFSLIDP